MNAANIHMVSQYGGVDVYMEDDDEYNNLEPYIDDPAFGMEFQLESDEVFSDEKAAPSEVDEETLQ